MLQINSRKKYTGERGSVILYIILCIFLLAGIVVLEFTIPQKTFAPEKNPAPEQKTRTTDVNKPLQNAATTTIVKQQQKATTSATFIEKTPPPIPLVPKAVPLSTKPIMQEKPPVPPAIPALAPLPSFENINTETRKAIINIICTAKNSGIFKPVSGSGVIIDPRGIILTNAHVANIYLLKDYPSEGFVECIIRTGSPAQNRYRAELLYISSVWIKTNKKSIAEENPTGTGENDFALLRITQTVSGTEPLPAAFPYIQYELAENDVALGQNVLVVGYPASFLGGITIQKDLHVTSTISSITKLYTFDQDGLLDLISVGTSILSQKGSSGGAVVRQQSSKLTGLIVTSTMGETTGERELNAVTIAHINRSIKKEAGLDLEAFLNADISLAARDFQKIVAPELTQMLVDVVEAQ